MAMLIIKCSSHLTSGMLAFPQPKCLLRQEALLSSFLQVFRSPFPPPPSPPSSHCVGAIHNWVPALAWIGEQVSISFFFIYLFFSEKCSSCSPVFLFSVYPLLDSSPLSPIPALHSCTKMSVKLQEQPPPGACSGLRHTSPVPAPMVRRFLLVTAGTGWHRGRREPTRTHHWGLLPACGLDYTCAHHKSSEGFW